MGPPLGARRSRTPAANTFPVAGQDRIFDIAFDATFIAARAIHRAAPPGIGPRADDCPPESSYLPLSFFSSVPAGDEDFDSLDDGGIGGVALDFDASADELDEDDGVDGEGCDDDAEDDDGGGVGDVD